MPKISIKLFGMGLFQLIGIFFVSYIVLLSVYHHQTRQYALTEAEKQMQDMLLNHRAIHSYVEKIQKPVIYKLKREGKLYQEFFSPEVLSFTYIARRIKDFANLERKREGLAEIYFKLASDNPRNPINKADDYEKELLKDFNDNFEHKKVVNVLKKDGEEYLYVALPITTNKKSCMRCHSTPNIAPEELIETYGSELGFHEEVGDIRAIISIRIPLSKHFADARKIFYALAISTFVILVIILIIISFFSYRLKKTNDLLSTSNNQLQKTLKNLTYTQEHLIESEKMASLGRLVAGFAHEINTPIGIAVAAASQSQFSASELKQLLSHDEVDEGELNKHIHSLDQTTLLILNNLERASSLVSSFKKTSIEQSLEEKHPFNLKTSIESLIFSLQLELNKHSVSNQLDLQDIQLDGVAGLYDQLLSNLVFNSLNHGFGTGSDTEHIIKIKCRRQDENVFISYQDNGKGMDEATLEKIFEPFFTTNRAKGGSGLGLFIVYNLVTNKLNGSIHCTSQPGQGVEFKIILPINND